MLQYVFQYPDTHGTEGDMLDAGPVDETARAAEEAGFAGFAFTEHPAPGARWLETGGHQSLDPFVALAYAAAATERIRLLTYLCVVPYRNPLLLAKSAATVDKLSGGRLILGVGTGYLKGEFRALGVDMHERNLLFDEALEALPLYWKGEPFDFSGIHFEARHTIGRPRPIQDPIPIWIGGNSKLTKRRVAERAQGWMPLVIAPEALSTVRTPGLGDLDELATAIAEIRDGAVGRPVDVLYPYLTPSIYANPDHDVAYHQGEFDRLADIGVTWVMIPGCSHSTKETLAFVETFGANFISR